MPASLQLFAQRTDLQRRIRSCTACYLDLGDFAVETTADGTRLLHLLSDSQWTRLWFILLDRSGQQPILTTTEPLGFDVDDDWWEDQEPPPARVPLDGSFDLEVCADSFAEFLYRFWIEDELWNALGDRPPRPHVNAYASGLCRGLDTDPHDYIASGWADGVGAAAVRWRIGHLGAG